MQRSARGSRPHRRALPRQSRRLVWLATGLLVAIAGCGSDDTDSIQQFIETQPEVAATSQPSTTSTEVATTTTTKPSTTTSTTTIPATSTTARATTTSTTSTITSTTTTSTSTTSTSTTTTSTTTTTTTPPVTAAAVPLPAAAPGITLRFDADGNDNQNKNDEWVRFTNNGPVDLDMTGWTVNDEGPHIYRFGTLLVTPGNAVTLFTGCGTDTEVERYWCNPGSAVWNNSGDTVFLSDSSGVLIAQKSG